MVMPQSVRLSVGLLMMMYDIVTSARSNHLCDIDFADDITLIADSWSSMQQTTTALTVEAGKVEMCTNIEKCKVLTTRPTVWNDRTDMRRHPGCRFRH